MGVRTHERPDDEDGGPRSERAREHEDEFAGQHVREQALRGSPRELDEPPPFPEPEKLEAGSDGLDHSPLGIYFREMAAAQLMSPAEELSAAQGILSRRQNYWRAIVSYPPFVPAIVEVVERTFHAPDCPREAIDALQSSSRNLRDRQTRAHEEKFNLDADQMAKIMARLDTDGEATEPIVADLKAIAAGRGADVRMAVTLPRTDSAPFRRYVQMVEEAAASLWAAKHAFVRANLRLVVTMARRYAHGRMALPDLIQEGNIGLLKAVDRFDPDRGYRFSTYASWWIRHAISRAVADKAREVRVPVHMLDVHHKLRRTKQRFEITQGREPGDEELAASAEVPVERVRRLRMCLLDQAPSLDSPISGNDARTAGELLEDETIPQPVEGIASRVMDAKIRELVERLPTIEADVLRKRFGLDEAEPMTLREIGEQYSLSRERIRQLQEQALSKIRRELRRQSLIP
ncbi:MAG: sigma-70 family RNA polymerase sigma factor [Deltaproteobacteria bacterium]|nr:sigma-70 family RNA polymerase sigma factor [Deltaproteobacteria bacterium]MBK8236866.1 sigma-70 family RNA polymerase sigma factor [Deltaproteobacteria bacterium]MBK8719078.1 sigma-70 family RNA polymerase sigma factor [Deltaproteobacteria bacterium]MBP7287993.1 sigma-70 family RNA polymerase sigma factor [Nannocystaceae bacterium]